MTRRTSSSSFDVLRRQDGEAPNTQVSLLSSQGDEPHGVDGSRPQEKTRAYTESQEVIRDSERKMKVGWRTPAMMGLCYIIAILIAVAHVILFIHIDNKPAEGPNRIVPQSYIITASNIFATAFSAFLRGALALAFAQYLWHILRLSTLRVSAIETLFSIRSNPFQLMKPSAVKASPVLLAIAILMWCLPILVAFPPGALTVTAVTKKSFEMVQVYSFEPSFMGNGSGTDAARYSLDIISNNGAALANETGDLIGAVAVGSQAYSAPLQRLAVGVMINGRQNPMLSPCGANCSYQIQFEGPYLKCERALTEDMNMESDQNSKIVEIYHGKLNTKLSEEDDPKFSAFAYNSTVLHTPTRYENNSITVTAESLLCRPYRALYTMKNRYIDNVHDFNISASPISRLVNLIPLDGDQGLSFYEVPGFSESTDGPVTMMNGTAKGYGNIPADWSQKAKDWYRDVNIINIIGSSLVPLLGGYVAMAASLGSISESIPGKVYTENIFYVDQYPLQPDEGGSLQADTGAQNGTMIAYTRFNTAYGSNNEQERKNQVLTFEGFQLPTISFNVTEDLLNSLLINVTLSIMTDYGLWNKSANATIENVLNVYSFSRPLNLYVPYGLGLLLTLVSIILGSLALHWNGVDAIDGGFLQLVTTTTASRRFNDVASKADMGGSENMPRELLDLKIRFGDVVDGEGDQVRRRIGFGVHDEVLPFDRRKGQVES